MNVCSYVKDKLRVLGEWRNTAVSGGAVPFAQPSGLGPLCSRRGVAAPLRGASRAARRGGCRRYTIKMLKRIEICSDNEA